ncbi:MAG: beta-glucoside-specific PTS transporter subunit IIABC [Eubacterium sp.]|nr:beta-glucoside-specific PTS transporter subunit IIABC [Eubacterium sp.]
MKYEAFNRQIIALVGGKENISAVVHCMTRLRFTLQDRSLAKTEEIKNMDGVIDVVSNEVAYQIIIGTHVAEVHEELISMLGISGEAPKAGNASKARKNPLKAALDLVSESMTPLLEPIIAAGMLAGLLSLVALTGLISAESATYAVLDSIRGAVFYFLPVFMAMSCASRLNASPYLAVALAATLLSTGINGVEGLSFFGIKLPTITYSSSFIPILLAVWFMGYVQTFLKKVIPNMLQYFLIPVFTLVITLPVTLMLFGPIGTWIGEGISWLCSFLADNLGNWSVVAFYAAIQPFLIMMGAGNFIMPVVMAFLSEMGYDPLFLAACTISDIAVGGTMLGYFLRAKNAKQKQLFGTVSFSAILGCTEPAVFGAFVKYRRPFVCVMIGGGLGGLFAGLMNVKTYTMAWGLAGLPSYIGQNDFNNFYYMIAAVAIGFAASATAGFVLCKPNLLPKEEGTADNGAGLDRKGHMAENKTENNSNNTRSGASAAYTLGTPAKGEIIPLSAVKDQAFSSGALGKGVGIRPSGQEIYAPADGEITCVFPTKHAIGLQSDDGVEVLLHIGIDTVQLEGKHFQVMVEQGQHIKRGDQLAVVDFAGIRADGYDDTIIAIVTNTQDYADVVAFVGTADTRDADCMRVIKKEESYEADHDR